MKSIMLLLLCMSAVTLYAQTKNGRHKVQQPVSITLHEGEWISNFKNEVFIRCLKKMYTENTAKLIEEEDASSAANADWLDFDKRVFLIADSLANAFIKKPEASYTIENSKVAMNVCMEYRNSVTLDKIAVKLYKLYYRKRM
jgi:hypothetical protein